ncbi:hypothetical protein GCM10023205_35880 [Yinghuangia aomiensis]|uniref:Polyketide cyclase / dehydrase and lipid transport n=1 Tax=Yinghuangia aomiensis TaxID=676205 RepID=A0ABP9HCW2_9ACTN
MHWVIRVDVEATPDDLWQVVADVDHWPEFMATMRRVERVGGAELGPGALVRIAQPRMPVLTWRVTDWTPGSFFAWQAASPGVTTTASHAVEARDAAGSTLTLGIHQTGFGAPLAGLLMGRQTRRYVGIEAESTKRRAEEAR